MARAAICGSIRAGGIERGVRSQAATAKPSLPTLDISVPGSSSGAGTLRWTLTKYYQSY